MSSSLAVRHYMGLEHLGVDHYFAQRYEEEEQDQG